jgi:hypothetical protein
MLFAGLAVAEKRTAPHMQPPWISWFKEAPPENARKLTVRPTPGLVSQKKSPAWAGL